jgi:uncharacterized membrane protein YbhN (UPF0104 family)
MTKRRSWILFLVKGFVSFALVTYLIHRVGLSNLGAGFPLPSLSTGIACCVLMTMQYAMISVRWAVVLQALGFSLAMRTVTQITLLTQFFSQVLPSSLGADLLRMWQSTRAGLPTIVSVNSVLIERITYLTGLTLIVAIVFPYCFETRISVLYSQYLAALAVLSLAATGTLAVMDRLPLAWLPTRTATYIFRLSADSRNVYRSPGGLFYGFVALLASQAAFSATLMLLGPEFGIEIEPADYLAVGSIITLLVAIPVSIAGWGVRELVLIELLSPLGADAPRVLQMSLALGVLNIVASIPGAILWIATKHTAAHQG